MKKEKYLLADCEVTLTDATTENRRVFIPSYTNRLLVDELTLKSPTMRGAYLPVERRLEVADAGVDRDALDLDHGERSAWDRETSGDDVFPPMDGPGRVLDMVAVTVGAGAMGRAWPVS